MPLPIAVPPRDMLLAETADGHALYARLPDERFPLYRQVKLICATPYHERRRVAYLGWIIHEARMRRGGAAWILHQHAPVLLDWIAAECARAFTPESVRADYGLEQAEWDALVAAEKAKYEKA